MMLLALMYFVPTFVCLMRHHTNAGPIVIINIFLGWTVVGWIVALAWSFSAQEGD